MQMKVVPYGDGIALVPDQALMDKVEIERDATLEVAVEGNTLIISLDRDDARREAFQKAVENMDRQYGEVFQRLAE
jgi:antitoxin component of MazEF toxin-antitoxin module